MAKAASAAPKAEEVDGRRARAEASRRKIVDALLALARDGEAAPSADLVAERAGVGRRTVFRLFKDMDSVYAEMNAVVLERLRPIMAMPVDGATWRERLLALIDRRVRYFEEVLPIKTAADVHRFRADLLDPSHAEAVRFMRRMMLSVLPPEIAAEDLRVEALDALLSMETWRRMRHDQHLSAEKALEVLRYAAVTLAG